MSLKYAKNAVIKGFVGVPDQTNIFGQNNTFADASTATAQERIDEIFTKSNNCRDGSTIFSDEQPFHTLSTQAASYSQVSSEGAYATAPATAPAPPMKKKEHPYATALLIGAGVFVLYKILS